MHTHNNFFKHILPWKIYFKFDESSFVKFIKDGLKSQNVYLIFYFTGFIQVL